MVRDFRPRVAEMDFSIGYRKSANVDAIQAQNRQLRREAAAGRCWAVMGAAEGFDKVKPPGQQVLGLVPPIVEVTGDDQR